MESSLFYPITISNFKPDQAIKTLQTSKHISQDAVRALTGRMQLGKLETAPSDAARVMLKIQEGFINVIFGETEYDEPEVFEASVMPADRSDR